MKHVSIHTDGSCLGNPGPGGYGAVLLHGDERREFSGGRKLTTNNRMELLACIVALEELAEPSVVSITTDSRYVHDAIEKRWLAKWKKNGWKTADRKDVKNKDLWTRLDELLSRHKVRLTWVRGHNGHPMNERCDRLARRAAQGAGLEPDTGYPAG